MSRALVLLLVVACSGEPKRTDVVMRAPADAAMAAISPDAAADPAPEAEPEDHKRPVLAVVKALPGIDVVESVNSSSHGHGGPPASIDHAWINVVIKDASTHTMEVTKLELLDGHCRTTTWDRRDRLTPSGFEVFGWDSSDPVATGTATVTLPAKPDMYSIHIKFPAVSVYQACNRNAYAIALKIDGKPVELELPLQVKRYDRLRRP